MKDVVRKYLEYVRNPENQYSSHRNRVSITLENGMRLVTGDVTFQSVCVFDKVGNGVYVDLWNSLAVYVLDGKEYDPVDYVMLLLFGET